MTNLTDSEEACVTILVAGDVCFNGDYLTYREEKSRPWAYPFERVRKHFLESDLRFVNLETTLFREEAKEVKLWMLHSPPESVAALEALKVDVLGLGNNHIMDGEEGGLTRTIKHLRDRGFCTIGAGSNAREANQPLVLNRNGLTIGFLSYTTPEEGVFSIIAGETTAGCASYLDNARDGIAALRERCDVVCVSLHWGRQFYSYPEPTQIQYARQLVEWGAHIVVGHHPHVLQGMEQYKNGVIFYSLGDFLLSNFVLQNGIRWVCPRESRVFLIAKIVVGKGGICSVTLVSGERNRRHELIPHEGRSADKFTAWFSGISECLTRPNYADLYAHYAESRAQYIRRRDAAYQLRVTVRQILTRRRVPSKRELRVAIAAMRIILRSYVGQKIRDIVEVVKMPKATANR